MGRAAALIKEGRVLVDLIATLLFKSLFIKTSPSLHRCSGAVISGTEETQAAAVTQWMQLIVHRLHRPAFESF